MFIKLHNIRYKVLVQFRIKFLKFSKSALRASDSCSFTHTSKKTYNKVLISHSVWSLSPIGWNLKLNQKTSRRCLLQLQLEGRLTLAIHISICMWTADTIRYIATNDAADANGRLTGVNKWLISNICLVELSRLSSTKSIYLKSLNFCRIMVYIKSFITQKT